MKKLAGLMLFFSLCFVFLFSAAILLGLLSYWIDTIRTVPTGPIAGLDAAGIAWKALPVAVYISILLTLSFSARRNLPIPLALPCIFILACVFSAGGALGISRAGALNLALRPIASIQERPGLVLSRSDNTVILLKESSDIRGSRVVSFSGQPLIYQEVPLGPNNTILSLPPLPFNEDTPWFVRSLDIDFSLSTGILKSRMEESYLSFGAYAFSLILLLASLRFLLELSRWPLANLFLGALVFRLVLALETFLNTREINTLIGSFLSGRLPSNLISPLVFCALAVLIIIYTALARGANRGAGKGKLPEEDPGPGRTVDD